MARRAKNAPKVVAATPESAAGHSYLEWSAVLGGTALALAISTVLFQFGAAIGLAVDAPLRGEGKVGALGVIAAGIWLIWVPLVSAMAGGYLAGMMRGRWPGASDQQAELRDGAHGLTVWAMSTLGAVAGAAVISAIAAIGANEAVATTADDAQAAAEIARKAGVIFGFVAAAASVLSAGVAWWAATLGGQHRDENLNAHDFVPNFLRS